MGPRAGLDRCVKSRPPLGFDPRTVASRYTHYANRPHASYRVLVTSKLSMFLTIKHTCDCVYYLLER